MILVNSKPLEVGLALNDPKNPFHEHAKQYNEGIQFLRDRYKRQVKFRRPDYPKYVRGADSKGREIPQMIEPTPPMRIALKAYATGPFGKDLWECCVDPPTVLPNGLWTLGRTKSIQIKDELLVDIDRDPDLAFFIYFKSPHMNPKRGGRGTGQLKIDDPLEDARQLGESEELVTERKFAVWKQLKDDNVVRMARAYGINVTGKPPQVLRKELEKQLETNDKLKRSNPAVKGTEEFITEMKVTDGVLLRAFVRQMMDEKRLTYLSNGWFKIGDKNIVQVPASDLKKPVDFICGILASGNNIEKLQEFLRDLLSNEYLDAITDKREWQWLYKVSGGNPQFKKQQDLETTVRSYFCPVV